MYCAEFDPGMWDWYSDEDFDPGTTVVEIIEALLAIGAQKVERYNVDGSVVVLA